MCVNKFGEELVEKAELTGWNNPGADVINIPTVANPAISYNVITEYGRLTTEDIQVHCVLTTS
jgi:hypothetical protein